MRSKEIEDLADKFLQEPCPEDEISDIRKASFITGYWAAVEHLKNIGKKHGVSL